MKISFVTPHAELQPYIESFWVLESPNGLPATAKSIAAPNGCAKLIVPYDNSIVSVADGRVQTSWAHRMYFVGNRDSATLIRSSARKTGFIVVEFRPHGAFPIFGVPMSETANRLWETDVVFGSWSREFQETINNLERVDEKVAYIERRLILLLRKNRREPSIVDYCVRALRSVDGRMSIGELEGTPAIRVAISTACFSSTLGCRRRFSRRSSGSSASIENGRPGCRSIC
jgi:uncharacterized protein DUF6597